MAGSKRSLHSADPGFSIYLEGPRDRDILRSWASCVSRDLGRAVDRNTVLLGGRRPVRAIDCHRRLRQEKDDVRGLCVLDRDGLPEAAETRKSEPGLDFFTWPRRQIESYLLVPEALLRCLSQPDVTGALESLIRGLVPHPQDEKSFREVDAKRLLSERGLLRSGMEPGVSSCLEPSRIARRMRETELHDDVRAVLIRLQKGFGLRVPEFYVVAR